MKKGIYNSCMKTKTNSGLAQSREQRISGINATDAGSSPAPAFFDTNDGGLAQLGEHLFCMQGVAGLTPVPSSVKENKMKLTKEEMKNTEAGKPGLNIGKNYRACKGCPYKSHAIANTIDNTNIERFMQRCLACTGNIDGRD